MSASFLLARRIFVSRLRFFFPPRFRSIALLHCFWPPCFSSVFHFLNPVRLFKIGIVVSDSKGSFRLSMSKFSLAMMARWNWSIQLVHWVGVSILWFGQKAAGIPRRIESVDCAIIRSVQMPLVY